MKSIQRVREICLALPEAVEQETWGHPTFRVNKKIFASFGEPDDRPSIVFKTRSDTDRDFLLARDDAFVPAYVGHRGWVGIRLDGKVDWNLVEEFVRLSYRKTAPKKLLKLL